MNNDTIYSASSFAVEYADKNIRLIFNVMNFAEYEKMIALFADESVFTINRNHPRNGGSIGGSKLVVDLSDAFADVASERLSQLSLRRHAEYVNGTRKVCESAGAAINLALNRP